VAAIIGIVGFALANLASDIIMGSTRGISPEVATLMSSVTRWAIIIFVVLAVLTQLGVASDLIRILFTGFVAMVALAGGIAFGLGGQDTARTVLETLRKKLK
jgi:small-conductance mechanosensitive channel